MNREGVLAKGRDETDYDWDESLLINFIHPNLLSQSLLNKRCVWLK